MHTDRYHGAYLATALLTLHVLTHSPTQLLASSSRHFFTWTMLRCVLTSPGETCTSPSFTSISPTSQVKPLAAIRALTSSVSWLGGKQRLATASTPQRWQGVGGCTGIVGWHCTMHAIGGIKVFPDMLSVFTCWKTLPSCLAVSSAATHLNVWRTNPGTSDLNTFRTKACCSMGVRPRMSSLVTRMKSSYPASAGTLTPAESGTSGPLQGPGDSAQHVSARSRNYEGTQSSSR